MIPFCLQKKISKKILWELEDWEPEDDYIVLPRSSVSQKTYAALNKRCRIKWI
jgi:hypothetical protein